MAATDSVRIAAIRIISATLARAGKHVPLDMTGAIAAAFYAANAHLIAHVTENPHHAGMGTTLVIALIADAALHVGNVGDSRCYLARGQTLQQLTHDDSYVQTLVDQNILTRDQADNDPRANELSRALGGLRDLDDLAITRHTLCPGDVVLLCSDGVWKGTQDAIRQTCQELALQPFTQAVLDEAAMRLVKTALDQGSDDNISVVLLWMAPARKPAVQPAAAEH